MLLKRNLLETITIISCSGTLVCIVLNYVTNISPLPGIWFPIYALLVFVVSVSLSFKFLQWLLHLNKPIKYDLEGLVRDYPYLSFLKKFLPQPRKRVKEECKEYDTNELSVITTVLERKLVSSWYVPYISQEIGFPFACKQMLDQMISKTFQICNKIEPKDVFVDMCSILISHLKEYRKAVKRHEKCPSKPIESLFKMSHPTSNPDNQVQSADHYTNLLRVVMKELVPWELWDTPQSELLVRILAKKLDSFIDSTLADPAWLNEKLLTLLKGKEEPATIPEENDQNIQKEFEEPSHVREEEVKIEKPSVESALSTLITKTTAPILQRAINEEFQNELTTTSGEEINNILEEVPVNTTEPMDIKSSPVLRQRRGRQGRNEVKIHDRIIEGSVKTWETDLDLQCISLGQDLLASLDGEITLSRLWEQEEAEGSPNPPRSKSPQPLWFGEEETMDVVEGEAVPQSSPARKEHSPKPADALLKDLQTTVHQAKTKIGDLQVPSVPLAVPRNQCSGDEAAGMMEGLLDFGIAGLKKGLRFTGLGDDTQEKSPSHRGEKISPPEGAKGKLAEPKEVIISSVIQKEENGSGPIPPLMKQQRVVSQDSVPSQARPIPREGPIIPAGDSPEPEYEEAADLSTSIAKLRCLLQQRAETSPRGVSAGGGVPTGGVSAGGGVSTGGVVSAGGGARDERDIWWEGAEETRGRTQLHHSSRPIDTATLADEYNMSIERNASPGQTSNNMQRLDRLFQRTVTGVFNSIKTAVGAEGAPGAAEGADDAPPLLHDWTYVCTSIEHSVCGAVARLVGSRRALAHVDAALDPLRHLPQRPQPPPQPEDFEEWCALVGAGWSGCSALAAAAGLSRAHAAHALAALLAADLAESLLEAWLSELSAWLRRQVFAAFEAGDAPPRPPPRPVDVDATVDAILERVPIASVVFGVASARLAAETCVRSVSARVLCADAARRVLDALALRLAQAARDDTPGLHDT